MKIFVGKNYTCNLNFAPHYIKNSLIGNQIVQDPSEADIILFLGTCACTSKQILTTLTHIAEVCSCKKPEAKVYVTGCIAKDINNPIISMSVTKILGKFASEIVPFDNPDKLLNLINPSRYPDTGAKVGNIEIDYEYGASNVYISNGCNNHCTFCKINYLDFPLQSVPFDTLTKWIDSLDNLGIGHIYLKGTNIAQYGYDLYHEYLLSELLNYIKNKDSIFSVELIGYGFADGIINNQVEAIRDNPKVKVLSGGLESGSNRLLKLMNKGFTAADFLNFVKESQRHYDKDYVLNVISGFPTETNLDIEMTVQLLRTVDPLFVNICQYSDSWFIPAHQYEQLSDEEKEEHTKEYIRKLTKHNIHFDI